MLLSAVTRARLQEHVNRRQKAVSAITIKKELDTLRATWNWGVRMGLVAQRFRRNP